MPIQWRNRTLKRLRTSKGDYWIKKGFSSFTFLLKMGTSLKDLSVSIKENQSTKWLVVSSTFCSQPANMHLNNFKYYGTYFTIFGIVIL